MSLVSWQPHIAPWLALALVVLVVAWAIRLRARMAARWGSSSWWLLAPKLLVVSLLGLALLDPSLLVNVPQPKRTLLVVIDQSSSMDVVDPQLHGQANVSASSRRQRAQALVAALKPPQGLGITTRYFDSHLHLQPAAATTAAADAPRGTDIAACLQEAARSTAAGSCAGMVVVSDGGDEPVASDGLPSVPISTVGMGSDLAGATNCAIVDCSAPATAERGVAFTISVDAMAVGPEDFLARAGAVELTLERRAAGDASWNQLASQRLDLSHGRARGEFPVLPSELGPAHYRVTLSPQPGEISVLDNQRSSLVDVRERSVHVLYYSRSLGLGYKPLRAELSRDPGVGFTALFQTIGGRLASRTGERFTVQGERAAADDGLGNGFPAASALLTHYDCIIIGSFPAAQWSQAQAKALLDYVAGGGAVVFMGGEESFGRGGYADTPLAALMPWQIQANEDAMLRGEISLDIARDAQGHAITQGLAQGMATGAKVASVNPVGPLRGGAQAIFDAVTAGGTIPVVAVQPYGKGKCMGIASDTLWRLDDPSSGNVFGVFWRQSVRYLADRGEGGQVLRVLWDKPAYRPGDAARASVRVTSVGGNTRLTAAVDGPDGHDDLTAETVPSSAGAAWQVDVPFAHRGDYRVRLVAYRDNAALETYEKEIDVVPSLPEGAHLARDEEGLTQLAVTHGGIYVPEENPEALQAWMESVARGGHQVQARSLISSGPWWFLVVAAGLLGEWIMRRRRNQI